VLVYRLALDGWMTGSTRSLGDIVAEKFRLLALPFAHMSASTPATDPAARQRIGTPS
jgi:hypothetical protein